MQELLSWTSWIQSTASQPSPLKLHIILSSHLRLVIYYFHVFWLKICMHFSYPTCPSLLIVLDLLPQWNVVNSSNYSAAYYVIFSIRLLCHLLRYSPEHLFLTFKHHIFKVNRWARTPALQSMYFDVFGCNQMPYILIFFQAANGLTQLWHVWLVLWELCYHVRFAVRNWQSLIFLF